jgi:spore coat polysaccharide biosynthesis protein SpsF (cytidylyltransferase family)
MNDYYNNSGTMYYTRLPGKIMLPVLEYLIVRVRKSSNIDEIIITT